MLTVGSLFSGIGGIDLGLERAGMEIRWQVESDPFCCKVLAKHWPKVQRFDDVRWFGGAERVDVLAGGFPCQDLSDAGKLGGITADQSGLWFDFAKTISALRPRFVFVENVPGLLIRGMGDVLGSLSSMGFDAEWGVIPAASFGAPHLRARVWILAYPHRILRDPRWSVLVGPYPWESERRSRWAREPAIPRVAYGLPGRVDRCRALANSVVPDIVEWIARSLIDAANRGEV